MRDFSEQFKRLLQICFDPKSDRNLFGDNDYPDGREHSVDRRLWKELAEYPGLKQSKKNLQYRCNSSDSKRRAIGIDVFGGDLPIGESVSAEILNTTQDDHDQPSSRAFDGQFRVAYQGGEDTTDHRCQDSRHGRETTC